MDAQKFRDFLEERKLSEEAITASVALAERFEDFFLDAGHPQRTKGDVLRFSKMLIDNGENILANYYALARYGSFVGNHEVYAGFVELLDGAEVMDNLYRKAGQILGNERRDAVFEGTSLPPMGLPNCEKVIVTQKVMPRLVAQADSRECEHILADSLRDLPDAWYEQDKKLYEDCQTVDEFLDRSSHNFIAMLGKIRDEGGLFFTQEISDEVIAYVRSEPLIGRGMREGDVLYEVKIPYMTREFLAARDETSRRYHYCHCPWVKEALKEGRPEIPAVFCSCSAGFHKRRWEVLLGQPLKAEMVESVLNGDDWCKIAIHLPEGLP